MMMVYCVMCVAENPANDATHIFSTKELADAFCVSDDREHVLFDYLLDQPERMEKGLSS